MKKMFKTLLVFSSLQTADLIVRGEQEHVAERNTRNLGRAIDEQEEVTMDKFRNLERVVTPHQLDRIPDYMIKALGPDGIGDRIVDLRRSNAEVDLARDGLTLKLGETVVFLI